MKALFFSTCVLTSALAFAAPDPAYVPASADLVVVADHLDQTPASQAVAIQNLKDAGLYTETKLSDLARFEPNLPTLIKSLLGLSEDCLSMTTTSITLSVNFPEAFSELGASNFGIYAVVDNPKMDLPTFTATLKEMTKDQSSITLAEAEGWTILRNEADLEGNLPFMGYRAVPGGVLFAFTDKPDIAKTVADKQAPSIAGSTNPLTAAFTSPEGTDGGTLAAVVKSVKEIVKRYNPSEEDQAQLAQRAPFALKASTVTFRTYTKGNDTFVSLEAATDDEATAQEVSEMFIAGKVAALQFLRGCGFIPADGALVKIVSAAKVTTEGTTAKLNLSANIEDGVKFTNEIQMLAAMMSMMMTPGPAMSPIDDPDLEWPEEEDDLEWIDEAEETEGEAKAE